MFIQKFADIAMFPGTFSSYDVTSFPETILIPGLVNMDRKIPCFLFVPKGGPKIMVIYAHANGVDIGEIHGRLRYISERLKVNILLFDYPGYGKHEGRSDESTVDQCMSLIVSFVTQELGWPIENVVLWGCSIGTGPSTRQAKILNEQKKRLGGLILQCPYKSIKHAAESLAGKVGRFLITQRWNIQSEVLECSCPILWIHGKKDSLFSWTGSFEMYNNYHANLRSCHFPKEATHHYFDIERDIIQPILKFLDKFVTPNLTTIYYGNYIKNGRRIKFDISKAYYSKLNPFRPTLLDVYLTRNINMKLHKDSSGNKKYLKDSTLKTIDEDDSDNVRTIGPKDIKSILSLWGNNNKNRDFFSTVNHKVNSLYLEGDFSPKYIWLNGEAGEYIDHLKDEELSRTKSSSSIYLSSSGEDEFEHNEYVNEEFDDFEDELSSDDGSSNEEIKCYNRLVNSNLILSNQQFYRSAKQCISYSNINVCSTISHKLANYQRLNSKKKNVILNNPSVFRMDCRTRVEKMISNSFTSDELLLNFWPISNLYCYLYDRYRHFFQVILQKIKQNNISFLNNSNDTFLSIIMWVRRLYYIYTPTLFVNVVYSFKSESDEWFLDGISIGNIYIQLQKINGINGRMVVRLLEDNTISKNFPPPHFITIPLYAPPKPFFQPIAEWIVRTLYRIHVYELFNVNTKYGSNNLLQKYPNIASYKDIMSLKETKCLLEELSFSSLQHFLLCNRRPKIEKLALITGFGNWIPFGWAEFIVKLFESNSVHFLQRIILNNMINDINMITSNYFCLLLPFHLPGFMNMEIIYKVIKTKIITRSEWNNGRNNSFLGESETPNDINNLIHPEICNHIFNTVFNVINTSLKISNIASMGGIDVGKFIFNSIFKSKYLLQNNQPNWEVILQDLESFSEFMSGINFFCPRISLPGISQVFRVKSNSKFTSKDELSKDQLNEDKARLYERNSINVAETKLGVDDKKNSVSCDHYLYGDESNEEYSVNESDLFYDETESPEQPLNSSFQGKIILMDGMNRIDNSYTVDDQIEKSYDENTNELPLTWESVFFNSSDPLLIINQLLYNDRIYMGMSPSNYTVFHRLLYEKYSFLRLDHESECIFKLLWHFSHCCLYHGSLLKNINKTKYFPYSNIHPLHCLLLISGIIRRAIENPNDADLSLLNWANNSNEKRYCGFNSSCYFKSSTKTLNILEKILSISMELIENGVCNTIIEYSTDIIRHGELNIDVNKNAQDKDIPTVTKHNKCITKSSSETKIDQAQIQKETKEEITSNSNISNSISSDSYNSSRISSLESLTLNFKSNQVNSNNLSYAENQRRVMIFSSTNTNIEMHSKEMQILKKTTSKRLIKDTRVVNLNSSYLRRNQFSPIIAGNISGLDIPNKDKQPCLGNNTCKGEDLPQDIKYKTKNKVSLSSPLKLFKK